MKPKIKKLWIEALKSGRYKKAKMHLRASDGYCCLGVLCDIHDKAMNEKSLWNDGSYDGRSEDLPLSVSKWSGVDFADEERLISINDSSESFDKVITFIESKL